MRSRSEQGGARLLVWHVTETAGFEAAWVALDGLTLRASGQAAGQLPEAYWLSYRLQTDSEARTTILDLTATTAGGVRTVELRRGSGGWTVDGESRPDLNHAFDCDIACSPLTNTMPIIRHGLQRGPGAEQFVMAFVEVPALRVVVSLQSYTHLGLDDRGARVRYSSGSFASDLVVDSQGLVLEYPTMASRLRATTAITDSERVRGPGSARPGAA
jgi:hypothetical protein